MSISCWVFRSRKRVANMHIVGEIAHCGRPRNSDASLVSSCPSDRQLIHDDLAAGQPPHQVGKLRQFMVDHRLNSRGDVG